jgi:hypothetical protein
VLDTLGVPLELGREARYANRAQRRALAARDGAVEKPRPSVSHLAGLLGQVLDERGRRPH